MATPGWGEREKFPHHTRWWDRFEASPLLPIQIAARRAMRRLVDITILTLCLGIIGGCQTLKGRPESIITGKLTLAEDIPNATLRKLLTATTDENRDTWLAEVLGQCDARYVAFRDDFLVNDNSFNAGIDLASLLVDVAGKLTTSAGVKDNYLSASALLGGSRTVVNSRFLYSQTGLALIKGMDAARAATELEIRQRQELGIDAYTGRNAYVDALRYYFAGTVYGGLIWLQGNAEKQETRSQEAMIRLLKVPDAAELAIRGDLRDRIETAFREKGTGRCDDEKAQNCFVSCSLVPVDWELSCKERNSISRDDFRREIAGRMRSGLDERLGEELTRSKFLEEKK